MKQYKINEVVYLIVIESDCVDCPKELGCVFTAIIKLRDIIAIGVNLKKIYIIGTANSYVLIVFYNN